jgi:hypothetical protein
MPHYFDLKYFTKCDEVHATPFKKVHNPGGTAGTSGIYKCESCGFEVFIKADGQLPLTLECDGHSPSWKKTKG